LIGADRAEVFHVAALDGLACMTARFRSHAFPRHMHKTYVVEVVGEGIDEFSCGPAAGGKPAYGVGDAAPGENPVRGRTFAAQPRNFRAGPGSIVAIDPFRVHTGRPGTDGTLAYRSIYPTAELMARLAGGIPARAPSFVEPVVDDPALAVAFVDAHRRLQQAPADAGDAGAMADVLRTLVRRHGRPVDALPADRSCAEGVWLAKRYLLDHLADNVSLERLSSVAGVSPFHLARCFRDAVGLPPHEFVLNVRIERCRQLIASGWSIADAASALGFADQAHLTRRFRRQVGVTPGRYR